MNIRRFNFLTRILRRPEDGEGSDLGGSPDITSTPAAEPVDTGAVVSDVAKPTTMLEAMSAAITPPLDANGQPRDELGRFAQKAAQEAAAAAGQPGAPAAPGAAPAAKPVDPLAPVVEEDPHKMPEGLSEKAQQRFQTLVNTNKELTEWRAEVEPQLNYVRETFQQNGIQREQFDLFSQFAGAFNRGDYQAATQILQGQMQALAAMTGQHLTADPLAQHPDLRERVDSLQMTEQDAMELGRRRLADQQREQIQQQQQQVQQREQQSQQAIQSAQGQIDQFCKTMQRTDMDYSAIEGQLLAAVQDGLLEGVPPNLWAAKVQQQYNLIKKVAASQRTLSPATSTLRTTGNGTPSQAPKTMMEAMFGGR